MADAALAAGQKYFRIHCFPFRMTDQRLAIAANDADERQWFSFWENLHAGYHAFEKTKRPPNGEDDDGW